MAQQRCSERRRHPARRFGRLGRLGLAGAIALALACVAEDRIPTGLGGDNGAVGIGGSGGGAGNAPEALLGTWRNTFIIELVGDIQTTTTTWQFRADGSCSKSTEIRSVIEGGPFTDTRSCHFSAAGTNLSVSFMGSTGPVVIGFGFAANSANRLLLDGFEFARVN